MLSQKLCTLGTVVRATFVIVLGGFRTSPAKVLRGVGYIVAWRVRRRQRWGDGTSPRGRRPSLRLTRRTAARLARPRGPPPRGTARACRTGRGRRRRTAPRRRAASRRGLAGAAIANEHRQIVCVSRRKTFAGDVRKPPRTITKVARTTAPSAHIFWESILPSLASHLSCCCAPHSRTEL